jgi:hypothetical protein
MNRQAGSSMMTGGSHLEGEEESDAVAEDRPTDEG